MVFFFFLISWLETKRGPCVKLTKTTQAAKIQRELLAFGRRTKKRRFHKPESMGEIPVAVIVASSKLLL